MSHKLLISLDVVDLLAEIGMKERTATSAAGKRMREAKSQLADMFTVCNGVVDGERLYLLTASQFGHFIRLRNDAGAANGIKNLCAKTVEAHEIPKTAIDVTGNGPAEESHAPAQADVSFAELGEKLDKVYAELAQLQFQPRVEVSLAVNAAEVDLPVEELGKLLKRQARRISEEINLHLNKRYLEDRHGLR